MVLVDGLVLLAVGRLARQPRAARVLRDALAGGVLGHFNALDDLLCSPQNAPPIAGVGHGAPVAVLMDVPAQYGRHVECPPVVPARLSALELRRQGLALHVVHALEVLQDRLGAHHGWHAAGVVGAGAAQVRPPKRFLRSPGHSQASARSQHRQLLWEVVEALPSPLRLLRSLPRLLRLPPFFRRPRWKCRVSLCQHTRAHANMRTIRLQLDYN